MLNLIKEEIEDKNGIEIEQVFDEFFKEREVYLIEALIAVSKRLNVECLLEAA